MDRWCQRKLLVFLLFLAATVLAYGPALGGSLIWDDTYLVGDNPFFKSPVFGWEVFRHYLFFESFSTYYRPVQNLSYMFDYWLWRGNPTGYHLTNLLLHCGSGFLLYLLLRRLLPALLERAGGSSRRSSVAALLVALVWLVHPIHNAAVAYIAGRADSLASWFALSAWLMALRAQTGERRGTRTAWSVAAAASMLLALCSKEIALLWLVLFVAHQWVFERQASQRARLIAVGAVLGLVAVYAFLHSLPAPRAPMAESWKPALPARTLLMFRALGDYAGLIVFPGDLHMERTLSNPEVQQSAALWRTHSRGEWLAVLGLLVMLGSVWLCRWRAPGRAVRWLGAGWFVIAFLPISNLFPLNAEVAEHWIYLASIGALLFAAGCILGLPQRGRVFAVGLVALAILAFTVRTAVRSADWVDAETFYTRTMAAGGVTPRIVITLASVYGQRGDFARQEQLLRKGIERYPAYTPIRISLGICLTRQGRGVEAETLLQPPREDAALTASRFPRTWNATLGLARVRYEAHQTDEALAILEEAQTRFPETWELVKYASELRVQMQRPAEALPATERFAARHWWHLDSWLTLATLRAACGQDEAAIAALQQASRLDIYEPQAHAAIAQLELVRGQSAAALDAQLEALTRAPGQPSLYLGLARILESLGRKPEADAAIRKAQLLASEARKS
ncbi:MAG: protein O-mannosyl-transferase [Chthoniobacter sp.]|nr:protein O-mannosyl-transferase [Chthoniobacter sp.]